MNPEVPVDKRSFSREDSLMRARHGVMEKLVGFSGLLHIIPYVGQLHDLHHRVS